MQHATRLALISTLLTPSLALAQDSDGDGANDVADVYPCDPSLAGLAFAPAEGQHAVLLFEDQWPDVGDADFNDVVVTYNYVVKLDAQNRAVGVIATFNALALGGAFDNGLGLQLPVPASAIASVTRTVGSGGATTLTPQAGDSQLTVRVSDNLRELFGGASGQLNALPNDPAVTSEAIQVDIVFATPTSLNIGLAPFDLFIFRSGDPTHEIHQSAYGGTAAMNAALFGTRSDRSTTNRWFTDGRGLPFALHLPQYDHHPAEAVDVSALWPRILNWAGTGGQQDADFYTSPVVTQAYSGGSPLQPVLLTTLPVPSTSCIAAQDVVFDCTGVIEPYVVPAGVFQMRIRAEGAAGGDSNQGGYLGGRGAFAEGVFTVTPGETLQLLAGCAGENWRGVGNWHAGTGGGGSFVARGASAASATPMLVAGGGGGASQSGHGEDAGSVVTAGGNGSGGTDSPGSNWSGASGGAGFHSNGAHSGDHPTCVRGQPLRAKSFVNGGAGGYISNFGCGLPDDVRGGFGGGGCSGSAAGGGGGGYIGGNVNNLGINNAGRAGTNYNAATSGASNGTLPGRGNGRIVITVNLPPPVLIVDNAALAVAPITAGQSPGACTPFAVTNSSASTVSGLALTITGAGAAAFSACPAATTPCGTSLAAGASCQYGVQLSTTSNGAHNAVALVSGAGVNDARRDLTGTASGFTGTGCTPGAGYVSGSQTFSYVGAMRTFTVPAGVCELTIHALGASGGDTNQGGHRGGYGADVQAFFAVQPGNILQILVGGVGENWRGIGNWHAGTGGGGSFVAMGTSPASSTPMLVAGGGGGASQTGPGEDSAVVTASGNGSGGTDGAGSNWSGASGGAGFHSNGGHNGDHPTCVAGQPLRAQSFVNGGAGGYISNFGCGLPDDVRGGFGGGGCSGSAAGGGGGGYVGGNVNNLGINNAGRAGTSYNAGIQPVNATRTGPGDGTITISW